MVVSSLVLAAAFEIGSIITWLIVGLLAGFIASMIMRGGGYGILGDLIVGLVGAFIGGIIADLLFPNASFHFFGTLIFAIIGACILIAILRAIAGGRTRRTL